MPAPASPVSMTVVGGILTRIVLVARPARLLPEPRSIQTVCSG
jgi:hypothetical protein